MLMIIDWYFSKYQYLCRQVKTPEWRGLRDWGEDVRCGLLHMGGGVCCSFCLLFGSIAKAIAGLGPVFPASNPSCVLESCLQVVLGPWTFLWPRHPPAASASLSLQLSRAPHTYPPAASQLSIPCFQGFCVCCHCLLSLLLQQRVLLSSHLTFR